MPQSGILAAHRVRTTRGVSCRAHHKTTSFKLVWDIEAQPDPRAVVPGLLYEGYQTVIEAGPKWGKTTLSR